MKATVLIIFILVAQVFADFHSVGFDGVDPDAYETSIDSMPIIADSVTKLFSLPDSSLIQAASDFYSFKMVFNPIRDSLILFMRNTPKNRWIHFGKRFYLIGRAGTCYTLRIYHQSPHRQGGLS